MRVLPRWTRSNDILIRFESQDFPAGRLAQVHGQLEVTWDDIAWAAITVGRPNRQYVFRHGRSSFYEALFRWSLIHMAVHRRGRFTNRIERTNAFKTLDPTEKGSVSYFLGMTFCKLFATGLLNTPWLIHLDVFHDQLNPDILTGRSRPDLVGEQLGSGDWFGFECKGRSSAPSAGDKDKAKTQAQRLISVDNQNCALQIGAFTFFKNDELQFYWRDPEPEDPEKLKPIELRVTKEIWAEYYGPITEVIRNSTVRQPLDDDELPLSLVEEADLSVGIHPEILPYLLDGSWQSANDAANEMREVLNIEGYQSDGLVIKCGPSWNGLRDDWKTG